MSNDVAKLSRIFALLFLVACMHTQRRPATAGMAVVGEEEIESLRAATAYDIVSRTHGEYLRSRGRQSLNSKLAEVPAHVYVDDTYYGDIQTLNSIPASNLSEVRFYQGYEAQYKFGSGHMGGVIQLITKR